MGMESMMPSGTFHTGNELTGKIECSHACCCQFGLLEEIWDPCCPGSTRPAWRQPAWASCKSWIIFKASCHSASGARTSGQRRLHMDRWRCLPGCRARKGQPAKSALRHAWLLLGRMGNLECAGQAHKIPFIYDTTSVKRVLADI